MPNKSHNNSGLRAMVALEKQGRKHSSFISSQTVQKTLHGVYIEDAVAFLKKMPDASVQLILIDPPYNLDLDAWDSIPDYLTWAKEWLNEIYRVLSDSGNCVIFGGFQFQDLKRGDLLEVLHYIRHSTDLRFINLIVWYYKNGMSAHRYFANRHEEAVWVSKTKKYFFDLDAVRVPYDDESKKMALKDKRLIPENIEKGKNPTNVWEIGRLNGNCEERVGHLTQKPLAIIRRFVRALSYEGSIVLDFFAGSGTTGRVCIEEGRHSIMVDNDPKLHGYFKKHLEKMTNQKSTPEYEIRSNAPIDELISEMRTDHAD